MSSEYVADVPYVRHFIPELSPARLRLAAALNGVTPPDGEDFDYLELGCAHGDTLCALAAAYPKARFVGIDLLAAHVATAKRLARDGGLENVGFLERDVTALDDDDLADCDFIVAHGVLSWIGPETRSALVALAQRKLKPGGILYVSYNAMPGWASVEPLRQLLLAPGGEGASVERARRGLELASALAKGGAEYFTKNPSASDMLETMQRAGLPYVVHEYLHEHWIPMYFARVAAEMAARDLYFVGVQPLALNFADTAIPPGLDAMFSAVTDRLRFESLKDFARGEFFRRDLYRRGPTTRSAAATDAYLDSTPFGILSNAPPAERTVRSEHRTLDLSGPLFDAILDALCDGGASAAALAVRPGLDRFSLAQIRAALVRLLVADAIVPLGAPTQFREASPAERYVVPLGYNRMLLGRTALDVPQVVVSPVAGTAFPISALDALALEVLAEPEADRRRWVDDFIARSVLRLRVGDRVLERPEDQRAAILDAVEQLVSGRLAKFVELGILAPLG